MGRRGPASTPKPILRQRGSWRGKEKATDPVAPPGIPPCPDWLTKPAKLVWAQAVEQLSRMKVLTTADGNALARYADALVRWKKAAADIDTDGDVFTLLDKNDSKRIVAIVPMPQVGLYHKYAAMLAKLEQEFGLTPASRSRIQVAKDDSPHPQDVAPQGKKRFFPQGPALRISG